MKQQFLLSTATDFQSYVYEFNLKVVPDLATITIYKPGGDNKLVDAAAMTVGSDGLLSYSLTAGQNSIEASNYKAVIAYTYGSVAHYVTLFYDVVLSRLVTVITDEDVVIELPQLRESGWRVHGTAEAGTATTLVDSELKRFEDDYFTGGTVRSLDKDEVRGVRNFVSSTGTVTVSAFSSSITTDKYIIMRSYSQEIHRAFEKIEERLVRLGRRPELVLDPYDLREVHIYYSVAEVCKALVTQKNDFWWEMWKSYEDKADTVFMSINFKYDSSSNGYVSESEAKTGLGVIRSTRG